MRMDRVLYSKYNAHRKPEFRLVTEIRENGDGKYAAKRPQGPEAEKHLRAMARNRLLLEKAYTGVKVLPVREEEGRLVFPFVRGISLEERAAQAYAGRESREDIEEFVRKTNELFSRMISVREDSLRPFAETEDFRRVFGEAAGLDGAEAVCPANADALFRNFIEQDGELICIDYEWVFDFPVPTDFIRYRALHYFYFERRESMFAGVSAEEFMEWFGIGEETRKRYEAMEYAFQQYVHGENIRYQYLHRYLKGSHDQGKEIEKLTQGVRERDQHILNYQAIVKDRERHIKGQEKIIRTKDAQYAQLYGSYLEVINSSAWRMTKPVRAALDWIKRTARGDSRIYLFLRALKRVFKSGPKEALAFWKQESKLLNRMMKPVNILSEEETNRQKATVFPRKITFSILVPLYNTPENFLTAMIDSVLDQTYAGWELCLADGSDAEHAYVGEICDRYVKKDSRIRYRKLEKNLGISENTNACLNMASGDYIGLFDHDDLLHPYALFEYMNAICDRDADFLYSDEATFKETPEDAYNQHFKPDFSPDTLRSYNYICHFTVFSRALLEKAGGLFNKEYDGSQDYDMILRLTEKAQSIVHIPKVLYYWRAHKESTSADVGNKPYIITAAKAALAAHLDRLGLKGSVQDSSIASSYQIWYDIEGDPLVSIIIPNKDHIDDLSKCLDSIREKSTWKNWEAIIVENNSTDPATFEYYRTIEAEDKRIRVVTWEREFNYSAINNFGAQYARGEILLLLNNDIEVITNDWLEQMIMFAQRRDVGAVGAMLYYPDETIQHAGVIIGLGGIAGHSHKNYLRGTPGYAIRLTIAQNLSAVTGACLMIRKAVWDEVGGLDEGFQVAFNDVDLCLKIRDAGYLIVWTPYAELYHYESKSRGYEDTPEKERRFEGEKARFGSKWGQVLIEGDPYYNPNLTLDREDFTPR